MQRRFIVIISTLMIFGMAFVAQSAEPAKGILYTKPVESVIFSHSDHLQKGTTCASCHSGLFEMEALKAQKNKDFTMDSLYKGKYCGACHNGKKAFASDTQCARCHVGANYPVPQKDTPSYKASVTLGKGNAGITFNHDKHLKKANCLSCHPSLFEPKEGAAKIKMADHASNKYCFTCHDEKGKKAFAWTNCNVCHRKSVPVPGKPVIFGKESKMGAVTFRHESHRMSDGCKTCHPKLFAYKAGTVKIGFKDHSGGQNCFSCHARKDGYAFYDCNRCHKR